MDSLLIGISLAAMVIFAAVGLLYGVGKGFFPMGAMGKIPATTRSPSAGP